MIAMYATFNRGYRAHPMPHALEGFKLAEVTQMNVRRWFWVMLLATVGGILAAFWAYLDVSYKIGSWPVVGNWGYVDLRRWQHGSAGEWLEGASRAPLALLTGATFGILCCRPFGRLGKTRSIRLLKFQGGRNSFQEEESC